MSLPLRHEFRVLSARPGVEGRVSRDQKVQYTFELTFSSEKAILETALNVIQTVKAHRWIKDNEWHPEDGPFRVDERGNRTLTAKERVRMMTPEQREELRRALQELK